MTKNTNPFVDSIRKRQIRDLGEKYQNRFFRHFGYVASGLSILLSIAFSRVMVHGGLSMAIIIPALVHLMAVYMAKKDDKKTTFYMALGLIGICTLIVSIIQPTFGLTMMVIFIAVYLFLNMIRADDLKNAIHTLPTMQSLMEDKVQQINRKSMKYQRKVEEIEKKQEEAKSYLTKVQSQLDDPDIGDNNRKTAQKLKSSLDKMIQRQNLLIRFYELARNRYDAQHKDLVYKLENLEILGFLKGQEDFTEGSEIEQTFLNMEFEKELEVLEDKLPAFEFSMEMTAEDYSDDSQRLLEESIARLESL